MIMPTVSECRWLPLARVERKRILPFPGDVIVAAGDAVGGLDIVARMTTLGQLRPIPLARYMQAKEALLRKYLVKKPGEFVQEHEIIASKPEYFGTLQRVYRAPSSGRIASLEGTWMTLDLSDEPLSLQALYRGTVKKVMPLQGVMIEAVGALGQCTWGTGEAYAALKPMVEAPNAMLMENMIDASARGNVLLAGRGVSDAAIRRAVKELAAGLIVGSLHPPQRELVLSLNLPTVLTEGFGEYAMSDPAFQLLMSHAGEEITLNGSVRANEMRPEVFVPAKSNTTEVLGATWPVGLTAQVGARVRVIAEPHMSALGKIATTPMFQTLENGISARGAEIEFNAGERVFVPWENIELID